MGLDLLPRTCPCPKHGALTAPEGLTHAEDATCPFDTDDFPKRMLGTCCSIDGKTISRELEALGEHELADRVYADMTHEEALAFAQELRDAVERLERAHGSKKRKPKGAGFNGHFDRDKRGVVWSKYSTFEEALAAIRQAIAWYEKTSTLGFGVDAWA